MISITLPMVRQVESSAVPGWKRGVDVATPEIPPGGNGLEPLPVPSGGGITVKPWWDIFPKDVPSAISRGLETPTLAPVGAVSKTIYKLGAGGLLAGGVGGFILGGLFGGGQEQQQDIDQDPTVIPIVDPDVTPTIITPITPTIDPTIYQTGEGTIIARVYLSSIKIFPSIV
ncbi:unnamed protein product [marine sediment metagenome]|uniref:Uncharacterized protein n=1 Tax=marine sediment metagenome TaxID=412755 RepID=X1KVV0_9ZZZZ